MATEVIMPKVDMVMETGTFFEWLKKEGEHVSKGDPLFVIETDKSAIEMESPADGILAGIRAKQNDVIPVTEVIAYILAPGESLPVKSIPQQVVTISAPPEARLIPVPEPAVVVAQAGGLDKVRVTPVARRLAKELHLDLTQMVGNGPRGRIHKADVLAFQQLHAVIERPETPATLPTPVPAAPVVAPVSVRPSASLPLPDARQKQVVPLAGAREDHR